VMFLLVNVLNTFSPISGIICLVCLLFLFFEAAFGICLGCKLYALVARQEPEYCPGEVCKVGERQEIQRTSPAQILILLGLVAYVALVAFLFHASFGGRPHALFGG